MNRLQGRVAATCLLLFVATFLSYHALSWHEPREKLFVFLDRLGIGERYTHVWAFGDSYSATDGIPSRKETAPFWRGRFTNGPVWVEYLADALGTGLSDFAVGGADIDKRVTNSTVRVISTDMTSQMARYFRQSEKIRRESHNRHLFTIWVGTNPLIMLLESWIESGETAMATTSAFEEMQRNVQVLIMQIAALVEFDTNISLDVLILGIPPLETSPRVREMTAGNDKQLAFCHDLRTRFTERLFARVEEAIVTRRSDIRVLTIDVATLWTQAVTVPKALGLKVGDIECFNRIKKSLCRVPELYLWFDNFHPSTAFHRVIAEQALTLMEEKWL